MEEGESCGAVYGGCVCNAVQEVQRYLGRCSAISGDAALSPALHQPHDLIHF